MAQLTSLRDAVASILRKGDRVFAAGFTHLSPLAASREIIRQRRKNLVLACAIPALIRDQMPFGGCVRKGIFPNDGNPGLVLLRAMRAEIETGRLEWGEYSSFSMISRLSVGAALRPAAGSGGAR